MIMLPLKRLSKAGLLLACLAVVVMAQARDWPKVLMPPHSTLNWIAKDTLFNGMRTRMADLHSELKLQQVLEFYRSQWAQPQYVNNKKVPGYIESQAGEWTIVSRVENDYMIVVQIQDSGMEGTQGYISINDLQKMPGRLGSGMDLPGGTVVINDMPSQDAGRSGRTMLVSNDLSVKGNADFFRHAYSNWGVVMDQSSEAGNAHILILKDAQSIANFYIESRGRKTYTVININQNGTIP